MVTQMGIMHQINIFEGEELKKDEILKIIAPTREDHDHVVSWFYSNGNY